MTVSEALKQLEALGTEQYRKTYARHGVGPRMFGVSTAHLGKLKKSIKVDQALAEGLWESGYHDARVLATMVADPEQTSAKLLNAWVRDVDNDPLAGYLAGLAARTGHAAKTAAAWTKAKAELKGAAGWSLLAALAQDDAGLDDDFFRPYLKVIEEDIHERANRVRYAMNGALIAIGGRSAALKKEALHVAKAIGTVEVDHGDTACVTPDAAGYIEKVWTRKMGKGK
jgi:3-methyladenine DNA glycosylase AlkD